jgi:hypothetical protein
MGVAPEPPSELESRSVNLFLIIFSSLVFSLVWKESGSSRMAQCPWWHYVNLDGQKLRVQPPSPRAIRGNSGGAISSLNRSPVRRLSMHRGVEPTSIYLRWLNAALIELLTGNPSGTLLSRRGDLGCGQRVAFHKILSDLLNSCRVVRQLGGSLPSLDGSTIRGTRSGHGNEFEMSRSFADLALAAGAHLKVVPYSCLS